jgi:hypothetical protein
LIYRQQQEEFAGNDMWDGRKIRKVVSASGQKILELSVF